MYNRLHAAFRKLPPSLRADLKRLIGSEGHGRSKFDWLTARKDATAKKRLDRAIDGVIATLGVDAAAQMSGKMCIDFGSGYTPTDGLALWLLGAAKVYGVDYNRIAKPKEIARAVNAADETLVEEQLRRLNINPEWRDRLDMLRRWAKSDAERFPPGYEYIAPADVIASPSLLPSFDVLVSTSVLEHIRPSHLVPLLDALKSRENGGALQCHRVDLRDHRDFERNPYGFLDPEAHFEPEAESDSRGNGMTLSDWKKLLNEHTEWQLHVINYEPGREELMPPNANVGPEHVVADSLLIRKLTA